MGADRMTIDHIAMYVNDLEEVRDFFIKYFNARSNEGYRNETTAFNSYFLSFEGGLRLELLNRPEMEDDKKSIYRTGYAHIAFSVGSREEVDRLTKRLSGYSFIFIGGGNTFRLLYEIRRVGMFEPILEYLKDGGVVFGGSAGAIIFGEDLESCRLDDENKVGLTETKGFDVLQGISFLCHFTNRSEEHDRRSEEYLLKISGHRKIIALPEEVTLFLNEDRLEEIKDRPYYVFENGIKRIAE